MKHVRSAPVESSRDRRRTARRAGAVAALALLALLPGAPGAAAAQGGAWVAGKPLPSVVRGCRLHPGVHCRGADLRLAQLFQASLHAADLRGARLGGANLAGADLRGARLAGAQLSPARRRSANGRGPGRLRPTILTLADLRGARLGRADLRRVSALGVDLSRARLQGADLRAAELADSRLQGANLRGADLRGADLRRTMLRGADLRGAGLRGADLHAADLRGARLDGANLVRADLGGALITRRQLVRARFLCMTAAAAGRLLRRDCGRLGIEDEVLTPTRLAPHLEGDAHGAVRHVRIRIGPRLAHRPRHRRRAARPAMASASSASCSPGPGADCAYAYRAYASGPGVYAPDSDLYMANFDWANLSGADLSGSFLAAAQFDGANLSDTNLSDTTGGLKPQTDVATNYNYANLERANLSGSNLRGAQFLGADLSFANLEGADLSEANLYGANLRGANLRGTIMEGTQLSAAGAQEADLLGSFAFDASFSQTNFEGALLGVYMQGAPGGGFSGEEHSLNLDQAGWTCGTVLPGGEVDNDDCRYTFQILATLIAGIAESVDGFEFGVVSNAALRTAIKSALQETTEDLGGTAIKLANWALFGGTPTELSEIVDSSAVIGAAQANVVPTVKLLGVKTGGIVWEVTAPSIDVTAEKALAAFKRASQSNTGLTLGEFVFNPIEEWSEQWEANLYTWWGTKSSGQHYAYAVGCPIREVLPEEPQYLCEMTGEPVMPPGAPGAAVVGG
jgi:uncharacterized protein YjbI with pentapeptide repeats